MASRGRGGSRSRSLSPTQEREADTEVSPLSTLAAHLKATPLEVAQMDPRIRERVAESIGMNVRELALAEIEAKRVLPPSARDAVSELTAQLSAQELRHLEPWRKRFQQMTLRKHVYMGMKLEDLKKKFLDLTKDSQVSPTESLMIWAALYAEPAERHLLACIIMSETDTDKMSMFNFHLAEKQGATFLAQYGEILTTFSLPLFPAESDFDLPNTKLLREAGAGAYGGEAMSKPTVFRRGRGDNDILGGGHLPLIQDQEGRWAADSTQLEAACKESFDAAFAGIRKLDERISSLAAVPAVTGFAPIVADLRKAIAQAQRQTRQRAPTFQREPHRQQQRPPRGRPRGGDSEAAPTTSRF